MLTGEIRNQVDAVWDAFWSGGISTWGDRTDHVSAVLEKVGRDSYEENKANRLGEPMERRIFPEGKDAKGRAFEDLRWRRFKYFAPAEMYEVVEQHAFPFLKELGGKGSTYASHMADARFTIPKASLLAKVVDLLDQIPMEDRDTKGTPMDVTGFEVRSEQTGRMQLWLKEEGEKKVSLASASDGTLRFMAILALLMAEHRKVFLEEIETGLHPSRYAAILSWVQCLEL